jgi:hypothetical protein
VLLKSGLPFEYFVSKVLQAHDFKVGGEYAYTREDKSGVPTECSVDFSATYELMQGAPFERGVELSLLVECKYNTPETSWVFSSRRRNDSERVGIELIDHFSGSFVPDRRLGRVPTERVGLKGVVLQSGDAQDQTITHGISQIQFAMPELVKNSLDWQLFSIDEYGLPVSMVGGILVASAPLRVLHDDLSLKTYLDANSLDEISEVVPYLCVANKAGPDLTRLCKKTYDDLVAAQPSFQKRVRQKHGCLRAAGHRPPLRGGVPNLFRDAARQIIVVNFEHLEAFLVLLKDIVQKVYESQIVVGRLEEAEQHADMVAHAGAAPRGKAAV